MLTVRNDSNILISSIMNEAMYYISAIEKKSMPEDFSHSRTCQFIQKAMDELGQALNKANGFPVKELNTYIQDELARLSEQGVDNRDMSFTTLKVNGSVNQALILCKKNGIYPFYVSRMAAAVLYDYAKVAKSPLQQQVVANGLKTAITELFGFENEPELAQLIKDAYREILDDQYFAWDEKKVELMKSAFQVAFANEAEYGGCPQCLIKSYLTIANKHDENSKFLFKSASTLSGGIAICNDSACGAYSGAALVIGSCLGRELKDLDDEDGEDGSKANDLSSKIHDKFIETYGTTICKEIHKNIFGRQFQFRKDGDLQAFREAGAHDDKCPMVVGMANAWTCEVLYDEGLLRAN